MLRKALLVLSGHAAASLLSLLRTIVLARLIPVEDFGIAATFGLAMAVVEMMSTFGLQQQIIQSRDGDDPRFQAALQGFQVLRGVIAAAALVALAVPIAAFMRIEEATWGLIVLGSVPLMNAFVHFDVHRFQRDSRFGPMILHSTLPALVSLLAVWPLAQWLGDWRVMLAAILLQAGLGLVLSHVVAERRFRIVFDRAIMGGSLRFGWPLLLNGILMFLTFNGDRLIVGRELGMAVLGVVSMGYTLTLTPTLVLAKTSQNLFLPTLSAAARAGDRHRVRFLTTSALQTALLVGSALVVGTHLVVAPLVVPVLGPGFAGLVPLLPLLAAIHALRVAKVGPSVVALAHGFSGNALWGNLPRVATLAVAWWALANGHDVITVLALAAIGEALGYIISLTRLDATVPVSWRPIVLPWGLSGLTAALAVSQTFWPLSYVSVTATFVALLLGQAWISRAATHVVRRR